MNKNTQPLSILMLASVLEFRLSELWCLSESWVSLSVLFFQVKMIESNGAHFCY